MQLHEYVKQGGYGTIKKLSYDSGVSYVTLKNVTKGMRLSNYQVARAISKATGWVVSVHELCETDEQRRERKRATKK